MWEGNIETRAMQLQPCSALARSQSPSAIRRPLGVYAETVCPLRFKVLPPPLQVLPPLIAAGAAAAAPVIIAHH